MEIGGGRGGGGGRAARQGGRTGRVEDRALRQHSAAVRPAPTDDTPRPVSTGHRPPTDTVSGRPAADRLHRQLTTFSAQCTPGPYLLTPGACGTTPSAPCPLSSRRGGSRERAAPITATAAVHETRLQGACRPAQPGPRTTGTAPSGLQSWSYWSTPGHCICGVPTAN